MELLNIIHAKENNRIKRKFKLLIPMDLNANTIENSNKLIDFMQAQDYDANISYDVVGKKNSTGLLGAFEFSNNGYKASVISVKAEYWCSEREYCYLRKKFEKLFEYEDISYRINETWRTVNTSEDSFSVGSLRINDKGTLWINKDYVLQERSRARFDILTEWNNN